MSEPILKLKPFAFALLGFFAALGLFLFSHVGPASAQSPGVNLAALVAQVNALQSKLPKDEQTIAALQAKTAPLTLSTDTTRSDGKTNTELNITGVNVHILSGSGYTDDGTQGEISGAELAGLGNLTIGYNVTGNGDVRTGSHNLILGDQNNYESFGGLIAGSHNTVSGPYATVSGGEGNAASAEYASVSGGTDNTASNIYASVSGGYKNKAIGGVTSVSGGSSVTQGILYGWSGGSYHTP